MKGSRKSHLSFRYRSVRFIASACVVGALLLVDHSAHAPASGDSPSSASTGVPRPQQYYLYAADGGGTGVSVYAIGPDGSLRPEAGPFAADEGPIKLVADPTNHFLYVANTGTRSRRHHYGDVTAFSVASDGLLRELPSSPYLVGGILQSLAITPNGRHLYTTNSGAIWPFAVEANGSIKLAPQIPVGTGTGAPVGLIVAPNGAHLYAVDFMLSPNGAVSVFSIGPHGGLTPAQGSPVADEGAPTGAIATTPDGSYLFVGNSRNVTAYSVRSDGALRLIGRFGEGVAATTMIAGSAGHVLYAGDAQTGTIEVYRIGPQGRLKALEAPIRTGANSSPQAFALTPDGHFLYVANSGSNTISAFRIRHNGTLGAVAGSPYPSPRGPDSLTIVGIGRPPLPGTASASATQASATGQLAPTQTPQSISCRKDPLAGVYHPWRLHINAPCLTVSGTVERVKTEPDHDWHVNLRLPPSSQHLINIKNRRREHGELVVEIIPMDQPHIPRPTVGERVSVTGAYVLDRDHGWEEIHPAWLVDGSGSVHYSAQAASRSVEIGIRGNESHYGKRR